MYQHYQKRPKSGKKKKSIIANQKVGIKKDHTFSVSFLSHSCLIEVLNSSFRGGTETLYIATVEYLNIVTMGPKLQLLNQVTTVNISLLIIHYKGHQESNARKTHFRSFPTQL